MAIIQHDLTLNLIPGGVPPVVNVNQYDTGRRLCVELVNGEETFTPTASYGVTVTGTKPTGTGFTYDNICTISNGKIYFMLNENMTVAAGLVYCVLILAYNGETVGTGAFFLRVQPAGLSEGTITDASDFGDIVSDAVAEYLAEQGDTLLPDVDATDNGKILRVINGRWAASTLNPAEEVSF